MSGLLLAAIGCASPVPPAPAPPARAPVQPPAPVGELVLHVGGPVGILDAPPAAGTPEAAADWAGVRAPVSDARRAQARKDVVLDPFVAFAPVLGPGFTAAAHPATDRLLKAIVKAEGPAINAPKDKHRRPRPFVADPKVATCTEATDALRQSGSYPSGHAAVGWTWALVLAELVPSRAAAVIRRGIEYGDSRVACGLHFPTDVEAGRIVGAAALARLQAEPEFRDAIAAARLELAGLSRED